MNQPAVVDVPAGRLRLAFIHAEWHADIVLLAQRLARTGRHGAIVACGRFCARYRPGRHPLHAAGGGDN